METDKIKLKRMIEDRNKRISQIKIQIHDFKSEIYYLEEQIDSIEKIIEQIANQELGK